MIYKKQIDLDENGKAIKCPKCNNEEILDGPYCKICGLELFNRCSNFEDSTWGECGQICDDNARFCHKCGSETMYYKLGIIPDYTSESKSKTFDEIIANSDDLPF